MTEYEEIQLAHLDQWLSFANGIPVGMDEDRLHEVIRDFLDGPQCEHDNILCKQVLSNGTIAYRMICRKCYGNAGNSIQHAMLTDEQKANAIPRFYPDWSTVNDKRKEAREGIYEILKKRKDSGFWQKYSAYLLSPAWAEKRLKVFERAHWKCEGCGKERATEVHHLTYDNVFDEYLFELVALCHGCHDKITREKNA